MSSNCRAEAGGLSGAPVREMATRVLAAFAAALKGEVALIGAGGIMSGAHAAEKFRDENRKIRLGQVDGKVAALDGHAQDSGAAFLLRSTRGKVMKNERLSVSPPKL